MCISKLRKLFKKEREQQKKEVPLEEMRWWSPKHFKRIVRLKNTSRGGPNMPKYQRCPECSGLAKRTVKVEVGAYYHCRKNPEHGESFVRR